MPTPVDKFWVSPFSSNWDNTNNWSTSSGGTSGVPVPGPGDIVTFDASGGGSCILDSTANVLGFRMQQGYTGFVDQNAYKITMGTQGGSFDGGLFSGSGADIYSYGSVYLGHSQFVSTDATFTVEGNLTFVQYAAPPQSEFVVVEDIPVFPADVANKYVSLSRIPDAIRTVVNLVHGGPQKFGVDYSISGIELRWGGLGMDGVVVAGDIFRIIYPTKLTPGFGGNGGVISMKARNTFVSGGGIHMNDFHVFSDTTSYLSVDGTSHVEGRLSLESGLVKEGINGVLKSRGDLYISPIFGQLATNNDAQILIDGPYKQALTTHGGYFPTLTTDKSSSEQVITWGPGPIRVRNDFIIEDGTFNTNGRDLIVGI